MKVQNAHQKLMHVKMKGDALDDYIAKFQHLRALAGWGEDDTGTLMLFKQGLTPGLHKAILEKTCYDPGSSLRKRNDLRGKDGSTSVLRNLTEGSAWADLEDNVSGMGAGGSKGESVTMAAEAGMEDTGSDGY